MPKAGDIFVMRPTDDVGFVFGRVAKSGVGPFGLFLVYVFRGRSADRAAVPDLDVSNLLLGPTVTNRQGWLKGYFETVENRPIGRGELLDEHWFWNQSFGRFQNEDDVSYPTGKEPPADCKVSISGVADFVYIGNEACEALGVRLDWLTSVYVR